MSRLSIYVALATLAVTPLAHAQEALVVVAAIGIFTAILAASIAMTQTDIKRVLAYSTLSQLGYMFAALGVGAFIAAIFHLMTHGFFKGLLFLGSGSVIHAVHEEQDMRRMGGLARKIPITYATMLIGSLAIAGIPPFSGFFSKDEILWLAFSGHHPVIWGLAVLGAGMTAFYMFRQLFMVFFGDCRADHHTQEHLHESPRVMTMPLVILAVGALLAGWIGLPAVFGGSLFAHWLEPVIVHGEHHGSHALELGLMAVSVSVAAAGAQVGGGAGRAGAAPGRP